MSKAINPNNPIFYVYVYLDPTKPGKYVYGEYEFNYEPFYIGEGHGKRMIAHLKGNKSNIEFFNHIQKIISITEDLPLIHFSYKNVIEGDALRLERMMIECIGRLNKETGPLYNKTAGGQGCSGMVCSEETKRKLRIIRSTQVFSEESRKKVSEVQKISMIGNKNGCKKYILLSPLNEIFITENLKEFSKNNNLYYNNIRLVSVGVYTHYKGWSCRKFNPNKSTNSYKNEMSNVIIKRNTMGYILTSQDNNEIFVNDLTQFCKENNIQRYGFYNVLKGKITSWKGWKIRKLY